MFGRVIIQGQAKPALAQSDGIDLELELPQGIVVEQNLNLIEKQLRSEWQLRLPEVDIVRHDSPLPMQANV